MNAFRTQKIKYKIKRKACRQEIFTNHSLQNLVIECESGKEEGEVKCNYIVVIVVESPQSIPPQMTGLNQRL